jgi:prephenate dehydrogenase
MLDIPARRKLRAISSHPRWSSRWKWISIHSSTTFDAQLDIARRVSRENPHLYFEIQSLNEHGPSVLNNLLSVMQGLTASVQHGDEAAFVAMMKEGNSYLETTITR